MTFLEMCGSIGYQPKNLNEMPIFGYFHVDLLTTSLLFVFLLFLLKPRIIPWLGENQTVPSSWDMVPQPSIFRIIWEWKVMRNPKRKQVHFPNKKSIYFILSKLTSWLIIRSENDGAF